MIQLAQRHGDAEAVLRYALLGARVTTSPLPRFPGLAARPHVRRWQAELSRYGSRTGVVCGIYELPCDPGDLARYARQRADDALRQRAGQLAQGESFMAGLDALPDVSRIHEVSR